MAFIQENVDAPERFILFLPSELSLQLSDKSLLSIGQNVAQK